MASLLPALAPRNVGDILPWTWVGTQFGFTNVFNQASTDPALESDIVSDVASYGRQLGRISETLVVVLRALQLDKPERQARLDPEDRTALIHFISLVEQINQLKIERHPSRAMAKQVQRLRQELADLKAQSRRPRGPRKSRVDRGPDTVTRSRSPNGRR